MNYAELLDRLAGITAVAEECYGSRDELYKVSIPLAIEQALGGFGVRRIDAELLCLARDLQEAAQDALDAEELRKQVKGLQLELGRRKKKITQMENDHMTTTHKALQMVVRNNEILRSVDVELDKEQD